MFQTKVSHNVFTKVLIAMGLVVILSGCNLDKGSMKSSATSGMNNSIDLMVHNSTPKASLVTDDLARSDVNKSIQDKEQKITSADIDGTHLSFEEGQVIAHLINVFKNKDIPTIAKNIKYPLSVATLPKIYNQEEFIQRYSELIDDRLFQLVGSSKISDWDHVGSRGIIFNDGAIWLDDNSTEIITINHKTDKQIILRDQAKKKLHSSVQKFKENILSFKTSDFMVRVDEMNDGSYRYASWKSDKSVSDIPDLVLTNGTHVTHGSKGDVEYIFEKNKYRYHVEHIFIGKQGPKYWLYIKKDDETVLKQGSKQQL